MGSLSTHGRWLYLVDDIYGAKSAAGGDAAPGANLEPDDGERGYLGRDPQPANSFGLEITGIADLNPPAQ